MKTPIRYSLSLTATLVLVSLASTAMASTVNANVERIGRDNREMRCVTDGVTMTCEFIDKGTGTGHF